MLWFVRTIFCTFTYEALFILVFLINSKNIMPEQYIFRYKDCKKVIFGFTGSNPSAIDRSISAKQDIDSVCSPDYSRLGRF